MMNLNKIREAKGVVKVTFLKDLGENKIGDKAEMHNSTALALATTGILELDSNKKVSKPTKSKKAK